MLQFCMDNELPRTLMTLQEESKVCLNHVDSVQSFTDDIRLGRWDVVLKWCTVLALPMACKVDLYELVIHEFIEAKELETVK